LAFIEALERAPRPLALSSCFLQVIMLIHWQGSISHHATL
jgi:hypothetical protein